MTQATTIIDWTTIEGCDACGADTCSFRVESDGTTVRACDLDDFTTGYLECALWSSNDHSDESGGEPLDANYGLDDLSLETLHGAIDDCRAFQRENAADLEAYSKQRHYSPALGSVMSYAGHDFWLTRNGHGAGFWDRGLGALGDRLSKASKAYGSVDLYVGDDGKVYGS